MNKENQETIADIIEEKRSEAQYIRENNDTLIGRMDALKLEEEAEHIEAVNKRELAAKDAEIGKLRTLVEGLLEAATIECSSCNYDCGPNRENCIIKQAQNYINKAK